MQNTIVEIPDAVFPTETPRENVRETELETLAEVSQSIVKDCCDDADEYLEEARVASSGE